MIKFSILTLFPELIEPYLQKLPYKRAVDKGLAEYEVWDLKNYAIDKRGTVDDRPYGGGVGMLLRVEPLFYALQDIFQEDPLEIAKRKDPKKRIVLLSPRGETYTQQKTQSFLNCEHVCLICGRYEGIDYRVEKFMTTDVISIGNYVLSGGEIPALAVAESLTRIIPGVLDTEATQIESFSNGKKEFPQYTRPEDFKNLKVPEILLSGNHADIKKWREDREEIINS